MTMLLILDEYQISVMLEEVKLNEEKGVVLLSCDFSDWMHRCLLSLYATCGESKPIELILANTVFFLYWMDIWMMHIATVISSKILFLDKV